MIEKGKDTLSRSARTDEQLRRLSASDFGRVKLTDDEKRRLRAINDKRLEEIERNAAAWSKAEQPVVEELRSMGFDVASVWDLFNRKEPWNKRERIKPYLDALPLLLKHLALDYPPAVREGIARAMAMPQSRFAWNDLVRFYRNEESNRAKDGLAVAVAAAADPSVLDELIVLVKDRKHGKSRLLLLSALARVKDPRAHAALMGLGTDPDLADEVQGILKRLKSKKTKAAKPTP